MVNQQAYQAIAEVLKQKEVQIVAVSKFKTVEDIAALYSLGQRDFGENYVQELLEKQAYFASQAQYQDIRWHFIGHLQRNKVKYLAPFIYMIHSVDSFKLLQEINKQAAQHNRTIACLLQIHIAEETTKFGLTSNEAIDLLSFYEAQKADIGNIQVHGIMGMATFTEDVAVLTKEFQELKALFSMLQTRFFLEPNSLFKEISMGMSNDYELAIENGSTMVRIGSLFFGNRS